MPDQSMQDGVLSLTAKVVSAYVSKNSLPTAALASVIAQIHQSLTALTGAQAVELVPAVPIKKSITPDYIISLEDGRKFKSMKRYLGLLGMSPVEYRQKWGLPANYPMVAPNYAAARSALAKTMGIGRKPKTVQPTKAKRTRSEARAA